MEINLSTNIKPNFFIMKTKRIKQYLNIKKRINSRKKSRKHSLGTNLLMGNLTLKEKISKMNISKLVHSSLLNNKKDFNKIFRKKQVLRTFPKNYLDQNFKNNLKHEPRLKEDSRYQVQKKNLKNNGLKSLEKQPIKIKSRQRLKSLKIKSSNSNNLN